MVVNNGEPGSGGGGGGGGAEGALAFVAIAVVLFFVIRIYSDYVTATGQAVKPGQKRQHSSSRKQRPASSIEDPADGPAPRQSVERSQEAASSGRRHGNNRRQPEEIVPDPDLETESQLAPTVKPHPINKPPRPSVTDTRGQIVIERSRPRGDDTLPWSDTPPRPRPVEDVGAGDAVADAGAAPVSLHRTAFFRRSNPYPGTFDDVQVGDRLSEISGMQLSGRRPSRSVYAYHPEEGPFKTILAMLAAGPADPPVTGLVYLFRNSEEQQKVRRHAVAAFGQGRTISTPRGTLRQWPHMDGYTISIEPDRYVVERDLTAKGRRFLNRSTEQVQEDE